MRKIAKTLLVISSLFPALQVYADAVNYTVKAEDIHNGYVIEKVWLSNYSKPTVSISNTNYAHGVAMPTGAKAADASALDITIGVERKRPFAIIRVPAYNAIAANGQGDQLNSFTLNVTEQPQSSSPRKLAAKFSDVPNSVLANGTWYKIAVPQTGFYKIDYNFLVSLGVTPADIDPANIRVFGNGGNVLSEDNRVARPSDLLENAISVVDNGDSKFDNGEYAIFYAIGPTGWVKDSTHQLFTHTKNLYTDTAYYFLTFNQGAGKRVQKQTQRTTANVSVDSFSYYDVYDSDAINPNSMGKLWYSDAYYAQIGVLSKSHNFQLGSYISNLTCSIYFVVSGQKGDAFSATVNGNTIGSYTYTAGIEGFTVLVPYTATWTGPCNSDNANVTVDFTALASTDQAFINYIEVNGRRALNMVGEQLSFRDWASVGSGNIAQFNLQGANANTIVWDITDPQTAIQMNGSLNGSTYNFTQDASMLHEFAAMNGSDLNIPKYIGTVANQNLHASTAADLIIVTYPGFLSQANQLADYHHSHDHMNVVVATTDQVFNEFSSGGQDISAIRDFAKMFYDRAGTDQTKMPKYLLLVGGASFDYKNRVANNCNYVPVFESAESFDLLNSYLADDFYGFLDDNECIEDYTIFNTLDLAVGRLPARNVDDANAMVNKILNYHNASTLGPWRISTTHVADMGCHDSAGDHMADADSVAKQVQLAGNNIFNREKIYVDALPLTSTPAGARCPLANAALDGQVFQGTFLINYNGHGNPLVWSTERILTNDDFDNWNNPNTLPIMVTATCDFGRFDQPSFVSSAEQIEIRPNGGAIAMLTTTQAVYATYNLELNTQYVNAQFSKNTDGSWNTFGTASMAGKNITYEMSKVPGELANFYKFVLLGDPALTPDFPEYNVSMDSIADNVTQLRTDTIKALGAYTMNGSVRDNSNNILTGFNGQVYVSFYDKPKDVITISGCDEVFSQQDNIVYKGKVTVTNGLFSVPFIAPKDINYVYGSGKVSTYADDGNVHDAAGTDTSYVVGGFSDHPNLSTTPPVVRPYINDSLFANGGITGSNTSLYVILYDQTGINVSGNNVGHDLTAVLDGAEETPYTLNNYYETAPNTYQRGYINFPISGLAPGKHSITVKAWDVNDNVGEGTVNFTVVDSNSVDIQQLMNYPNPFSNSTTFVFEHNHPFEQLDAQIDIYTTSGTLVKKINQQFTATDSRSEQMTWDGVDDHGSKLPSGVYLYRLILSTEKGDRSSTYQKLVIIR